MVLGAAAIVQPYGGVFATEAPPRHNKKGHHTPKNPAVGMSKASGLRRKENLLKQKPNTSPEGK